MMYKNDFELIYLYRQNKSEAVMELIIKKYTPLIWKNIYKFYIPIKDQDDFFQEAVMTLYTCVMTFDEFRNKTFTKYFELVLFRRFITLKDQSAKYVLIEKPELIKDSYTPVYDDIYLGDIYLSPLEQKVYQMYFKERMTHASIAKSLNKSLKSIKNTIYRIKVKLKEKNVL